LAIIADLFPLERRGRVMGVVQTAFAASQVLGLPLGLMLSNLWGWHAPFIMIFAVGTVVGVVMIVGLRPVTDHLSLQRNENAFRHMLSTVVHRRHIVAFCGTALLVTGGFMLMPFGSAFSVNNLGIPLEKLPIVYMATGFVSIIFGPLAGKLADSLGKYKLFCIGSMLTTAVVVFYCNLGITPIVEVIVINSLLFAGITARMISASALMSAVPDPKHRGSFMAVSSSVQQLSGGIASAIAGLIVVQTASGKLEHYDLLGYIVGAAVVATIIMFYFINRMVMATVKPTETRTAA
jgi:predicted MFS family arabinose efflux permease